MGGAPPAVKMTRDRKCILCETVHVSNQEMDEHMRSMLHHRELEKLKGRDCGHECRVCGVTVVSLTDYASHISSSSHKQRVEEAERTQLASGHHEDYFDSEMVDLIERRKEQLRREKEVAALKLAKEEEARRKQMEFQRRLSEAKERYQLCRTLQPWNKGFGGRSDGGPPWQGPAQGRSATWHAQQPPNFQRWGSGDLHSPTWGGNSMGPGAFRGHAGRMPWLSNGGSSYGVYGRNNIGQDPRNHPQHGFFGSPSHPPPPPLLSGGSQQKNNEKRGQQKSRPPTAEPQRSRPPTAEPQRSETEHGGSKSAKSLGSNPKLDKACRWSPYPTAKASDPSASSTKTHKQEKAAETGGGVRPSRPDQKAAVQLTSRGPKENEEEKKAKKKKEVPESRSRSSSSSSRSSSSQPDGQRISSSTASGLEADKPHSDQGHNPGQDPSSKQNSAAQSWKLSDPFKKTLLVVLDKNSVNCQLEASQQKEPPQEIKESSCGSGESEPPGADANQTLQSLQVSTSTAGPNAPPSRVEGGPASAPGPGLESAADPGSESADEAQAGAAAATSAPFKLDLPMALKRDLGKHISCKGKAGVREPNLNIARRVRNLSEKDSGLKPTVRQLISTSGSRRNVNWEQVYQEVRKKQDKGRGKPRFGIEMVPYEQEEQSQEEDELLLAEGFHWEALTVASAPAGSSSRKRSLSESSVAPSHGLAHSLFPSGASEEEVGREGGLGQSLDQSRADTVMSEVAKTLQRSDSVLGDSGSGPEQGDTQGAGKRRRAAGDLLSPEASSPEHDSKRRRTKSKRERLHIDQLLAVSLREEELSCSLQTVDSNLVQARATLEAAFLEVQRLMVLKQQITVEMSTLRNKRIDLLKGMQAGVVGEISQVTVKEEKKESVEVDLQHTQPSGPDPAAALPEREPPPRSFTAVTVKQEPGSPVHVSCELDSVERSLHLAHSTTPEPPPTAAAATAPSAADFGLPGRERPAESVEKGNHTTATPDCKISLARLVAAAAAKELDAAAERSAFLQPSSPAELRSGKRVRKLKKKKSQRKSQGAEPAESSDTEADGEAARPRWLRPRRRPSGGSQVSTSSPPRDRDAAELTAESEEGMEVQSPAQLPQPSQSPRPEAQSLEVTSTSDMDICKSSESEMSLPKITKAASDVSSDRGEDEDPTEGPFEGHQEAVNAMQIFSGMLYTCSGDRSVRAFDLVSRKCVAVFEGHTSKVSCLLVSAAPGLQRRLFTGSSDQSVRCYSLKTQQLEQIFSLSDRVLCLHTRWKMLYAGLANGTVVTFDLKTNKQVDVFDCHGPRAVSCLASTQEGARRLLLVGSYDCSISVRDAKNGLLLRTLQGHTKSVLCMKVVNDLVFSGSSDQCVYAHNIHTGNLVRVYKGHSHAVTVVTVLGRVMLTACLDKRVRVYDLKTRELLQVYGGHTDMVMCLSTHKNMIYTGCYDGSVQAVKLNLLQKLRCWWHGCSLVFGVMEHLQLHLLDDHATATGLQTLRCRWKDCEEAFCSRSSSKQALLLHMQKHAREQTEVEP